LHALGRVFRSCSTSHQVISKSPEPISRGIIDSSYRPDKLPGKRIAGWQAASRQGTDLLSVAFLRLANCHSP